MKATDLISELKLLLAEEGAPLASFEDAAYFRQKWTPPKTEKIVRDLPPPPAPVPVPILAPAPIPIPVTVAPPPPPLPEPVVAVHTPPPVSSTTSFEEIRRVVKKVYPELRILDEIPNDSMAKKIAQRWKTKNQAAPISILSLHEPKEQRALLEQIAVALDVYFGPARLIEAEVIEKEKQWEAFLSVEGLKLVVVCDYTLWQLHGLMKSYKETPATATRLLGSVPLLLLPDLSLYLKDPQLKRSLWKALCQKLSS